MRSWIKIILLITQIFGVLSANFLILNPLASPSHHIWNRVWMEGLAANKEHNLTILSSDIDEKTLPNMHYIHLEKTYETIYKGSGESDLTDWLENSPVKGIIVGREFIKINWEGVLKSEGLNRILNYPDDFKFDAVIYDYSLGPCLLPLLVKFNYPPLIAINAFINSHFKMDLIGGHLFAAYVPHYALPYGSTEMGFFQRVRNMLLYQFEFLYRQFYFNSMYDELIKGRFNFKDMPTLQELERRTTIMLTNSNFAFDFPEPTLPNMIHVGGLQVVDPKPLPNDIKTFIEASKKGTILIAFGTNVRSDTLKKDIINDILETIKSFPEFNFLWKFESDTLPAERPKNLMISKFLSQRDILAHPKIKAFVSHCGLLSSHEVAWRGKPVVAVPFFMDQMKNSARLVHLGVAEFVSIREWKVQAFKDAVSKVLEDPKYTENAQKLSKRMQDQPERPLKRAIWWIEYILRHPNPQHLRSPTLDMTFITSNSYDVIFLVVVAIITTVQMIKKFIKFLISLVRKPKVDVEDVDETKKTN